MSILTGEEINKQAKEDWIRLVAEFMCDRMIAQRGRDDSVKGLFSSPSDILELHEEHLASAPRFEEGQEIPSYGKLIIRPLEEDQLNDDGFDLTVGNFVYTVDTIQPEGIGIPRLDGLFLAGNAGKKVLKDGEQMELLPGKKYYVTSKEGITVPGNLELVVDSKSSLGRIGCLCHDVSEENAFSNGSNLIALVRPYSFPIKVTAGKSRILQAVLRYKESSHMTREEILDNRAKIGIKVNGEEVTLEKNLTEDKIAMHFSTHHAYVSKTGGEAIDVDQRGVYDWRNYFEEVNGDGEMTLEPGRLYLLGTKENMRFENVCGRLSREGGGLLAGSWSQLAGLIHAGFYGEITLEVMSQDRRIIRDGDVAGTVEVDLLDKEIAKGQGSYLGQKAPMLPKMFRLD